MKISLINPEKFLCGLGIVGKEIYCDYYWAVLISLLRSEQLMLSLLTGNFYIHCSGKMCFCTSSPFLSHFYLFSPAFWATDECSWFLLPQWAYSTIRLSVFPQVEDSMLTILTMPIFHTSNWFFRVFILSFSLPFQALPLFYWDCW